MLPWKRKNCTTSMVNRRKLIAKSGPLKVHFRLKKTYPIIGIDTNIHDGKIPYENIPPDQRIKNSSSMGSNAQNLNIRLFISTKIVSLFHPLTYCIVPWPKCN